MRILLLSCVLTLIASCGRADLEKSVKAIDGAPGRDGTSCTFGSNANGTTLTCNGQTVDLSSSNANSCNFVQNADRSVTITCLGKPTIVIPACSSCSNGGSTPSWPNQPTTPSQPNWPNQPTQPTQPQQPNWPSQNTPGTSSQCQIEIDCYGNIYKVCNGQTTKVGHTN